MLDTKRFARHRREAGLSQERLAQDIKLAKNTIGKWEKGAADPTVSNLATACAVMGCTLEDVVRLPRRVPYSQRKQRNGNGNGRQKGAAS